MGQEKGLVPWQERPLAQQALERLRPQVHTVALNVNRCFDRYSPWGVPLWRDADPSHCQGPLAGILAGLQNMETPWLLTVPCDAPRFPSDLAQKFCQALAKQPALAALACTADAHHGTQNHPVFAMVHRDLTPSLIEFLTAGERKVGLWLAQQQALPVLFDEPEAFINLNSPTDLQAWPTAL
jgi:molybdopterin-guanine dinucleotide biosynthesis protein A